MTELLTAAQMRALETAAIASGQVTGLELMERAGRGVVEAVFTEWPDLAAGPHRVVVLCGPGGNGGDGFVVARLLRECGWTVEVFLYGAPEKMPPDARVNHDRWAVLGAVGAWDARIGLRLFETAPALVVDALFGIGANRAPPEAVAEVLATLPSHNRSGVPVAHVAVDIPTGVQADTGRLLDEDPTAPAVFGADLTVTFHRAKPGHYLADGPVFCGKLVVADLGLDDLAGTASGSDPIRHQSPEPALCLVSPALLRRDFPRGARGTAFDRLAKRAGHKFTHGHALILAGSVGRGGAARLAARGALRIGAGLVTIACPPVALIENAARLDAVMLRPVKDARDLGELLEDKRINALCLGPGMGVARASKMLAVALDRSRGMSRAAVLDADALTALAEEPEMFALLHPACVLTPHGGEFARLFPDLGARLAAPALSGHACSKLDATREAAARAGCVVLFKGADTVIADPSGRCSINSAQYDRAAPWLATAGSGDVLAGLVTGLLARGFQPMQAAETAAWLHVECARHFGPGLIAEDLPEELPKVFRALGL